MKTFAIPLFLVFSIIFSGCLSSGGSGPEASFIPLSTSQASSGIKVAIFKSPTCGCCNLYVDYLEENGFQVEVTDTPNMASIKQRHNIPPDMQSCHTMVIGDYFVEGHVPIEAINRLLSEKPLVDGIALPGMPSGSPGMPGRKQGYFTIYASSDGASSIFMRQ